MPTFNYQAKQGPEKIIEGTLEAASQDDVVARLLRDGLVPVIIRVQAETETTEAARTRRVHVRAKERRLMTRQLTSLLRAKVELVPAVTILREQSTAPGLRALLEDLEQQMRDGHPLSEALARHPRVFSPLFLSAIRAGEAAGKLDDILLRLVAFDEQQEQLESRLRGALAYPLLLGVIGVACVGFFVWFVIPKMATLFEQLGGALPGPTQWLINGSAVLQRYWWGIGLGLLVLGSLGRLLWRLPAVTGAVERLLRRTPFARDILEARQIGRFTRTLQLLLHSGLSVFQALDVARPALGSPLLEARLRQAQELVKQGESVAASFRAGRCFPPLVTQMVAVGESAGTLVEVLDELSNYYERVLDETLRMATTLLEPLMIVLMGGMVGFCVLAMVLPIFQMTQLAQ